MKNKALLFLTLSWGSQLFSGTGFVVTATTYTSDETVPVQYNFHTYAPRQGFAFFSFHAIEQW